MIRSNSNASLNLLHLKDHHNYQFNDLNNLIDFVNYLEWLLPYDCENKLQLIDLASKEMELNKISYLSLSYINFYKHIGYASRIDLSICLVKPNINIVKANNFTTPYYTSLDRNEALCSEQ